MVLQRSLAMMAKRAAVALLGPVVMWAAWKFGNFGPLLRTIAFAWIWVMSGVAAVAVAKVFDPRPVATVDDHELRVLNWFRWKAVAVDEVLDVAGPLVVSQFVVVNPPRLHVYTAAGTTPLAVSGADYDELSEFKAHLMELAR